MKAFCVGLLFLAVMAILGGLAMLLFPLLIVLTFFVRILLSAVLIIGIIWLLGTFILWVWERMDRMPPGER